MEKWDTTTCTTSASWSDLNGDAGGSGSGSHHDVSSESDDDDDAETEEEEEEEDVYTYGSETASERRIIKERRKKRKLEMMDDSTPMLLVGIKTVTYNGKDKIQLAPPRGATYKVSCDSKNIVFHYPEIFILVNLTYILICFMDTLFSTFLETQVSLLPMITLTLARQQ